MTREERLVNPQQKKASGFGYEKVSQDYLQKRELKQGGGGLAAACRT